MRIPIPIFTQRIRRSLAVPGQCTGCGAQQGFSVEQHEIRIWLAFLPMGASNEHLAGRCSACGARAPEAALKRVRPFFLLRFGWLFFLVGPGLIAGAIFGVDAYRDNKRRSETVARFAEEERKRRAKYDEEHGALDSCIAAHKEAHAAEDACDAGLWAKLGEISKNIDAERERAPAQKAGLLPLPSLASALEGDMLWRSNSMPKGAYVNRSACPIEFPDNERWSEPGKYPCEYAPHTVSELQQLAATMRKRAKEIKPADKFVAVTEQCDEKSGQCRVTVAWVDVVGRSLLAVLHGAAASAKADGSSGQMRPIAEQLRRKMAAWK